MKKSLKILSIALLCGIMLIALTGCGNKIKAVKETDEGKEVLELTFKDDKVVEVKNSMTFEDKEEAEEAYEFLKELMDDEDNDEMKVESSGKKITIIMKGDLAEVEYKDMTREEIIEKLEKQDYEVK